MCKGEASEFFPHLSAELINMMRAFSLVHCNSVELLLNIYVRPSSFAQQMAALNFLCGLQLYSDIPLGIFKLFLKRPLKSSDNKIAECL